MNYQNDLAFAKAQDAQDPLKEYRAQFYIPQVNGKDSFYFTGNSLGLQPKTARKFVEEEMKNWETLGVEGHFAKVKRPWMNYHKFSKEALAKIVGAKPIEVVTMNNLTVNLHLLMVSFYKPTATRFKVICEAGAFPSDQYMFETQLKFHGLNPELALILIGGLQYYTGQLFDMKSITEAGHKVGAIVGFDLAHAAGNVPLQLHDWKVDFATWCSYKYLNSGPGNVSGVFVNEKYANDPSLNRFAGWWGHDEKERFLMKKGFQPMPGADGWQLSNVNVISTAAHLASLEIYDKVGMEALREKSLKLTGYLEFLMKELSKVADIFEILTPSNPEERGCQLSIFFHKDGRRLFDALSKAGVIADWREPNVIRVAPVPLYNTFEDIYQFAAILKDNL
uniref:kynureninase n=1 Tax=Roseivirga sp. TaxID=1964215 RepID=UPI00404750DF